VEYSTPVDLHAVVAMFFEFPAKDPRNSSSDHSSSYEPDPSNGANAFVSFVNTYVTGENTGADSTTKGSEYTEVPLNELEPTIF